MKDMKFLKFLLVILFTCFLISCSNEETTPEKTPVETPQETPEEVKYVVTFDVDGALTTAEVAEGEKASKPLDPVKEGFTFLGWYAGEEEFDFETNVTSDMTLVAKFEEVKYVVTFDVDGALTTSEVKYNEKVVKPVDPVKDGFAFLGWYLDGEEYDFESLVTANLTLVAKFEEITLTQLEYEVIVPNQKILEGEEMSITVNSNLDIAFKFEIDNLDIAYIDEYGLFMAYEAGVVVLTVTPCDDNYKDQVKTVEIIIEKVYSKPININIEVNNGCKVGSSVDFTIKIFPDTAKQEYYYVVSDEAIGYMDGDTFVSLKEGETDITIFHVDGDLSTTITMNVYKYAVNETVTLYDGVDRVMTSSEYWIEQQENPNEVLLTLDQIKAFNTKAYVTANTKLVDILNQPDTITGTKVKDMINSYSISNSIKINGSAMTSEYRSNLINNTNKNNIPTTVTIKYGIINEFSSLRTFPTMDLATTTNSFDRFQETGLEVGNGCLIYHTSLDGNWYFIQMFNYYGWVLKDKVTEVSKDEMTSYVNPEEFVVVIAKDTKVGNLNVRMSTKFPLLKEEENHYTLITVGKSGLEITKVEKSDNLHLGYLDYTKANILTQIFKLLDEPYRWGDGLFDGHDCSSTMNAVYHCFGFVMSRNTSNQEKLPYNTYNVSGKSDNEKRQILDNLQVGSLVFVSGHVMMYLGKVGSDYYIIHNFNSYGGCNITTSRLLRTGSTTYLSAYTVFLEFK